MPTPSPRVSVVLPVLNGERYLREAVESILAQTYRELELIVIDDGSTDATAAILGAVTDSRLIVRTHASNSGIARSLNEGIQAARGEFIARMDADDVSLPERLARQVAFLDANRSCAVVGTWTTIVTEEGDRSNRGHRHPTDPLEVAWATLFDSPLVHPSVMMRTSVAREAGGYPAGTPAPYPEDYALWSRMVRRAQMANIPEPLLVYRETAGSLSRGKYDTLVMHVRRISGGTIAWATGRDESDTDCADLAALLHGDRAPLRAPHRLPILVRLLFLAAEGVSRSVGAPPRSLRHAARERASEIIQAYTSHGRDYLMSRFRRLRS